MLKPDGLLQQLQYFLLHAVRLRQSADTCLAEHLELGEVAGSLSVVGRANV